VSGKSGRGAAGVTVAVPNREGIERKGRRYLCEGRLSVLHVSAEAVRATCRGGAGLYSVRWTAGMGWSCDCEARSRCAHRVALELVVVVPPA
jgi:hypothetical protein